MPRKAEEAPPAGPVYKPGYIVYVRSGGPEMTIESIEPNGDLNCVWFTMGNDEEWKMPCRDRFIAPTVQLAVDGDAVDSRRGEFVEDDSHLLPPVPEDSIQALIRKRAEAKAKAKGEAVDPPPPPKPRRRY